MKKYNNRQIARLNITLYWTELICVPISMLILTLDVNFHEQL